ELELKTDLHRIQLTVDNPFVLVDGQTLELPVAVRSLGGQLRVPIALIDLLPQDSTLTRLIYDAHRGLVLRVPAEGLVRTPRLERGAAQVRITFPTEHPEDVAVVDRSHAHFRVRFGGLFVGALPESLPPGMMRSARVIPAALGSAFEFTLAPEAQGYRLETSTHGDA